jgi:hypothetical protein
VRRKAIFVWINKEVQVNLNHVFRIIRLADVTLKVYLPEDYSYQVDAEYESSVLDAARLLGRVNPEDFPIQEQDGRQYPRHLLVAEKPY